MPGKGPAFVKGGLGCIGLLVVLGFLAVVLGGRAHADPGGLLLEKPVPEAAKIPVE